MTKVFYILTISLSLMASSYKCHFSNLFLSQNNPELNEVSKVYINLFHELAPNLLTPQFIDLLKTSKDIFAIPEGSKLESDSLATALREFKEMLLGRYDEVELRNEMINALEQEIVTGEIVQKKQVVLDQDYGIRLRVLHKFKEPFTSDVYTGQGVHLVELEGKQLFIYATHLESPNEGKYIVAIDPKKKLARSQFISAGEGLLTNPTVISHNGKSVLLYSGKFRHFIDSEFNFSSPNIYNLEKKIKKYDAGIKSGQTIVRTSSKVLPWDNEKLAVTAVLMTDPHQVDQRTYSAGKAEHTEFKILDTKTGEIILSHKTDEGDFVIGDLATDNNETYFTLGKRNRQSLVFGKKDSQGKVTSYEFKGPEKNRGSFSIGYPDEGKIFKNQEGIMQYVFPSEINKGISVVDFSNPSKVNDISFELGFSNALKVFKEPAGTFAFIEGDPIGYMAVNGVRDRYGSLAKIDLESNKIIKYIPIPDRHTSTSIFENGGKKYAIWGTKNGKISMMDLENYEVESSHVIENYKVDSVTPYKEEGEWRAFVTFSGVYAKIHYGPVLMRLMKEKK